MLPSQVFPRREPASTGAVCLADGGAAARGPARARERGAVIVHVAVALTGLLAFAALTIDLGTVWVARAQAQNAVDAAALAGAVSLAYVDPANTDAAMAAARAIAHEHSIWGDPVTDGILQVASGTCPAGAPAAGGDCINIAVERGSGIGTPLPTFFAGLYGSGSARIRASASAKVMIGNATTCLRPWAIPDRWVEASGAPSRETDTYQAYVPGTSTPLPGLRDSYVPLGYETGFIGSSLELQRADLVDHPEIGIVGNQFAMLEMPNAMPGYEERYQENIETCNPMPVSVGQSLPLTQVGMDFTEEAVSRLVATDPGAYWDGTTVRGSNFSVSPRVVPMALYDPEALAATGPVTIGTSVVIRNIVGFFVLESVGGRLRGVVMPMAGAYDQATPNVPDSSAFLRTMALVR